MGERYVVCFELLLDACLRFELLDKRGRYASSWLQICTKTNYDFRPPWFALWKTRWRAGEVFMLAHILPLIKVCSPPQRSFLLFMC